MVAHAGYHRIRPLHDAYMRHHAPLMRHACLLDRTNGVCFRGSIRVQDGARLSFTIVQAICRMVAKVRRRAQETRSEAGWMVHEPSYRLGANNDAVRREKAEGEGEGRKRRVWGTGRRSLR